MSVHGSHRWVRQRIDAHLPSRQPRRVAWPRRGTPGPDVSSTSGHCSDKTQLSHYFLSLMNTGGRESRRSACLNTVSGFRLMSAAHPRQDQAASRQCRAGVDGGPNVATSSSLASTKCAAQQSSHAQTRLRKRRCESGAGPAQLPALTCASTGAALSGQ